MFFISKTPIETEAFRKEFLNPQAGALVIFEGWVRNSNENKEVIAMEYECFEELARKEALKIIKEAGSKFEMRDARCVHRVGRLKIGEIAVWIGVSAAHREAAFEACRYIIDQLKGRVPIWKKEYYSNGDSDWANCRLSSNHAGAG